MSRRIFDPYPLRVCDHCAAPLSKHYGPYAVCDPRDGKNPQRNRFAHTCPSGDCGGCINGLRNPSERPRRAPGETP